MIAEESTDPLPIWSVRLAARIAPDEIDLAPDLVAAYAAGGADRRALFRRRRVQPGAFGADIALVLPYLCQALDVCYHDLRAILADPSVTNLTAIATLAVAIRESRAHRRADRETEKEKADDLAAKIVDELAEDPQSAIEFLDRLHGRNGHNSDKKP